MYSLFTRLLLLTLLAAPAANAADCVVLLHGLIRSSQSMDKLEKAFRKEGFAVANVSYPSRRMPIAELAPLAVEAGLNECGENTPVHFVTHSLGGILLRYYYAEREPANVGRVVMIAPPNGGSEIVDNLGNFPGFDLILGPAADELGTGSNSVPLSIGPVNFETGVIAGTKSINPITSPQLPGMDDGTVSLASAKVAGMTDFITLPHSHSFIMGAKDTVLQAVAFVKTGHFVHASE